jgi:hypothetical protein
MKNNCLALWALVNVRSSLVKGKIIGTDDYEKIKSHVRDANEAGIIWVEGVTHLAKFVPGYSITHNEAVDMVMKEFTNWSTVIVGSSPLNGIVNHAYNQLINSPSMVSLRNT